MSTWSSRERFAATLAGQLPDRPPISAWRHFIDSEHGADNLARAHIDFAREWGWDWVKINPRSVYYSEAWGKTFDADDYWDVLPKQTSQPISAVGDLGKITRLDPLKTPALAEHIEAAELIRAGLPEIPLIQTIFSPFAVLQDLAGLGMFPGPSPFSRVYGSSEPISRQELLTGDRAALHATLRAIAETLAAFVSELLSDRVGLDGIFFALMGTAQPGFVSAADFAELSTKYDHIVLEAAAGKARILHTCGPNSNPQLFRDYPIDAINWDQSADGNPGLTADLGHVPVGGVSQLLIANGSAEAVAAATQEALKTAAGKPFLLTPGCALPLASANNNIGAFRSQIKE